MTRAPLRSVSVARFKASAADLSDGIHASGAAIAVVHAGSVIASVRPAGRKAVSHGAISRNAREVRSNYGRHPGALAHLVVFAGDIESPIDADWTADAGRG
jgi:hypothetical protein